MNSSKIKNIIIRMFHVHKHYGSQKALVDVTIDIKKKEFLFITGPSGAGKSTLLKLLYLGEKVTSGQIIIDGMNLARISPKRIPILRRKCGIIFQDYKLIPDKTVFENLALVPEAAGDRKQLIEKKVRFALKTVEMENKRNSYPPRLSGGEQQRIAVARAIIGRPKIIIADEPTGSLDPKSAGTIISLLKKTHNNGTTMIVATHDKALIQEIGGRVILLNKGYLVSSYIL